jgi:hypothetical protein
VLAATDPSGNPTTGIIRKSTTRAFFSSTSNNIKVAAQGGSKAWNPAKYLNVWVGDLDDQNPNTGLLLGYAYPPFGHPTGQVLFGLQIRCRVLFCIIRFLVEITPGQRELYLQVGKEGLLSTNSDIISVCATFGAIHHFSLQVVPLTII